MKSKTQRTLKSTPAKAEPLANALAGGHRPVAQLSPQDMSLFRAFQSNLLSLISHELRTPLTGILNALTVLDENAAHGMSQPELIRMALDNAQRLQHALGALLDLAAIESGSFHLRLKEVNFVRYLKNLHQNFLKQYFQKQWGGRELQLEWKDFTDSHQASPLFSPLFIDAKKFEKAVEMGIQILILRAIPQSIIQMRIYSNALELECSITSQSAEYWSLAWSQSLAGIQGGVSSPYSAFVGVLQSEQAFLTRSEEGLGSEFLLIHEIMKLHRGSFHASLKKGSAKNDPAKNVSAIMRFELPELTTEEGLKAVLASRAYSVSHELGSMGLILIPVSRLSDVKSLRETVTQCLRLSTDAVYLLESRQQMAVILNDCKKEEIPRWLKRFEKRWGKKITCGFSHCPDDSLDPSELFEIAGSNL